MCINAAVESQIGRQLREMNENKASSLNILLCASECHSPTEPVSSLLTGGLILRHKMLTIWFLRPFSLAAFDHF